MKFHAEIHDTKHEIEIRRDEERAFAWVDGREYEVEVSEPEPGVILIKNGGQVYEAVVPGSEADKTVNVRLRGSEFEIRLIDRKRLRGGGSSDDHSDERAEIRTAMPGKVVRILKSEGDEVEKGDAVLVVEAMKMQNEMKSPKNGLVKRISVVEGATVAPGDVLVTIE